MVEIIKYKPPDYKCLDCGFLDDCPMVHNELWLSVANKKDVLCLDCFEKRIGRLIKLEDLNNSLWSKTLLKLVARVKEGKL